MKQTGVAKHFFSICVNAHAPSSLPPMHPSPSEHDSAMSRPVGQKEERPVRNEH